MGWIYEAVTFRHPAQELFPQNVKGRIYKSRERNLDFIFLTVVNTKTNSNLNNKGK
jgi:hypothetical protein